MATEYGIDAKKEEGEDAIKNSKNSDKDGRHFSKSRGGLIVKFAEVVEYCFGISIDWENVSLYLSLNLGD